MIIILAGFIALRLVDVIFFDVLVFLISILAVAEITRAMVKAEKKFFMWPVILMPAVVMACYFFTSSMSDAILFQSLALLIVFICSMVMELIIKKQEEGRLLEATVRTVGLSVYPTILIGTLYGINAFGLETGLVGIITVFAVASMTDTFAYIFGSWLKGKRLCPEISPNKGIPGMIFGAIGGILTAALCLTFFHFVPVVDSALSSISSLKAILLFLTIGVLGTFLTQFGDLLESAMKRNLKIKDFGQIMPGHGGILDRMDGIMFCSALVFLLFSILL